MPLKKGGRVRAVREKLEGSLEALANDRRWPNYLFETDGEVLELRGDYALVKFGAVPLPPVYLRQDQLVEVEGAAPVDA
jgi:hypothetical protein